MENEIEIFVFSQKGIQEFVTDRPHIIISIREPNSPGYDVQKATIPESPNCIGILWLDFCDMDGERFPKTQTMPEEYKLFSDDDAKSILTFLKLTYKYINLIAVQCPGGISRSAAVAGALAKVLGQDDSKFFIRPYVPNKFIYRKILNQYMDTGIIGDLK